MNKHRIAALLLAALMTAAAFVSCGDDAATPAGGGAQDNVGKEAADEVTEAETTEDEGEPDLPEADFGGDTFNLLTAGETNSYVEKYIVVEEMNGEVVNDAIYERNRAVEENFNCKFIATFQEGATAYATKAVMAGDNTFFAVYDRKNQLSAGVQKHIYSDMNQLKYCDFTAPYWDKNCVEELSIAGKTYMMASDISMMNLAAPRFLYFNKKIMEDYGIRSPYDYVHENEWTLDNFLPMVTKVSEDLNGDGVMDREDKFGMLTEDGAGNGNILYFLVGSNIRSTTNDENGIPQLSFYSEKAQSVIEKVAAVLKDKSTCIEYNVCARGADYSQFHHLYEYCRSLFAAGHFMFVQNGCSESVQFTDMMDDYGVVPNPKYDSAQAEYYHRTDPYCTLIAVPLTNTDFERTGMFLEWMSWKSSRTLLPAFYETTIKLKRQRDENAMEMLDIVKGSIYYDIADIYGLGISDVIWNAYNKEDLASVYAKNESKMQKNLDKLVAAITEG